MKSIFRNPVPGKQLKNSLIVSFFGVGIKGISSYIRKLILFHEYKRFAYFEASAPVIKHLTSEIYISLWIF